MISFLCLALLPVSFAFAEEPIDFDTQIMAVLSKHGCNSAACHGSAGGRGGLQLSLFGSEPDLDFDQIVRERQGRRIHRTEPESSLVLLKATNTIGHEGGLRFDSDSREYRLIRDWIAQNARRIRSRKLERIVIEPATLVIQDEGQTASFRVLATFDQGETVDVSEDSVIRALDDESLHLDGTKVIARRAGQHAVQVRYLDQVGLLQVILPYSATSNQELPSHGFIDDAINDSLNRMGIVPVPRADDLTLYRRLSLDLLGELPEFSDAQAFADSDDADKYERLVDRMLVDDRFAQLWTWHLAEWLRVGGSGQDEKVATQYQTWIRKRMLGDASLAQLAKESLTATGNIENGATGFYRLTTNPGIQAELACSAWMGVRIGCANCHNHPLDHWKRTEYFQLAAFFAGIRRDVEVRDSSDRALINPVTRKLAEPILPDSDEPVSDNPRQDLADWMTSDENPYFAHSTANRIWAILMGRGIYEPVDDFRETNPVSNSALLDGLAEFHRSSHFELRPLIRAIVLSEAYQRATSVDPVTSQDRFYWRFLPREVPAPVLLGSIDRVTTTEEFASPTDWLSISVPAKSRELTLLGQCDRNATCLPLSATSAAHDGLAENLALLSGSLLNERIEQPGGFLLRKLSAGESDRELLNGVYLRAFTRFPTAEEQSYWIAELAEKTESGVRLELWQDIMWSILNSREFVTNH